jgi:hypothetical protein
MNVRRIFKLYLFFALALLLVACNGQQVSGGPYVWIDVPTDGLRVPSGRAVRIEGHASYGNGIARIEIWVNGEPHLVQDALSVQGSLTHFDQMWMPPGDGEYVIQAVAIGDDGVESVPDVVRLYIGEAVAEASPTPSPVPVEPTEVSATMTPTPVATDVTAPTDVPPPTDTIPPPTATVPPPTLTPTPTPPPEASIQFGADSEEIDAGKCTKLRWDVQNVQAVFLGGDGVAGKGSKEVCPCEDTTYVLSIQLLDGGTMERSVTVRVKGSCVVPTTKPTVAPPDTDPPPVPSIVSPTGGVGLGCDKVILDWDGVTDPSGVTYRVQVEQQITASKWDEVSGSPWKDLTPTKLVLDLDCGGIYRWRVRAEDGAGNDGAYSGWAEFGVALP